MASNHSPCADVVVFPDLLFDMPSLSTDLSPLSGGVGVNPGGSCGPSNTGQKVGNINLL